MPLRGWAIDDFTMIMDVICMVKGGELDEAEDVWAGRTVETSVDLQDDML